MTGRGFGTGAIGASIAVGAWVFLFAAMVFDSEPLGFVALVLFCPGSFVALWLSGLPFRRRQKNAGFWAALERYPEVGLAALNCVLVGVHLAFVVAIFAAD